MKDEIKEILDYFRTYATIKETNMIKKVYDYITNLQEANKKLQNRNIELVLERDRLKENNNVMQEEMAMTWKKIDNATKYMNNYIETEESNEPVKIEFKVVRNILQGEDKK